MNILKKIKLANKIIKIYSDIQKYNEKNRITPDTKQDIENIKNSIEELANRIPVYKDLLNIIKEDLSLGYKE